MAQPWYERIYFNFRQQLYTYALSITRNAERAEDAVHDAFANVARLSATPNNPKGYLFRVVRNAAFDIAKKSTDRSVELDESIYCPNGDPAKTARDRESESRIDRALKTLSPDERETIVQHVHSDLSFREIAEIRDVPLGTVTSWYRRGLEKMKQRLEDRL